MKQWFYLILSKWITIRWFSHTFSSFHFITEGLHWGFRVPHKMRARWTNNELLSNQKTNIFTNNTTIGLAITKFCRVFFFHGNKFHYYFSFFPPKYRTVSSSENLWEKINNSFTKWTNNYKLILSMVFIIVPLMAMTM